MESVTESGLAQMATDESPDDDPLLLDVPATDPVRLEKFQRLDHPIWTENKAKLIERYLYYFVWVTRHGTYIDGFAGPQRADEPSMWAAKLVLENRPAWLRHFHLFDNDPEQVALLQALQDEQLAACPDKRSIDVYPGDFNETVGPFLRANPIKSSEATFCLIDQRTFECDWCTVATLATHKAKGHKIELFYFLASGWIHRAAGGMKEKNKNERLRKWFGNDGWEAFLNERSYTRAKIFTDRFRDELEYTYVTAFPIFGDENGKRTMYWMIHASDHPQALRLMHRAYRHALDTKETDQQMELISRQAEALGDSTTSS
jgi:three-Cys-motif partner protein